MATANTTSSTRKQAAAPKFTQATNPLSHEHTEDTMLAVHAVLGFMSCAITAMIEQDASEFDLGDHDIGGGIKLILDSCCGALGAHLTHEGGAA